MVPKRQLAAIMFTDIVGYTALMGQQEDRALKIIDENKAIQKPLVEEYEGKWHKDLGDGSLCSFPSSANAVKCGIAIQQKLGKEVDYKVRIGIHLGDVTFNKGDVFGDGVNVAARIQAEATEGGICISESVYNSIKGNESIKTEFLGKRNLKNVSEPQKLYQIKALGVSTRQTSEKKMISWISAFFLILFFSGISSITIWMIKSKPDSKNIVRASIQVPEGILSLQDVAISPKGNFLAFSANEEQSGGSGLYLRPLDSFVSQRIGNGVNPLFSNDEKWLIYYEDGRFKKYSIVSKTTIDISKVNATFINGAFISEDDTIYFVSGSKPFVTKVSLDGGVQKNLSIDLDNEPFVGLRLSNGISTSRNFLANIFVASNLQPKMAQINFLTGKVDFLAIEGSRPAYINNRYIIYTRPEGLAAVSYDPNKGTTGSKAIPVLENTDLYAISQNGTLAYISGSSILDYDLVWVNNEGVEETAVQDISYFTSPRISPDGKYLLYKPRSNPGSPLWELNLERKTYRPLSYTEGSFYHIWFPDGDRISFFSRDSSAIYSLNTRTNEPPKKLYKSEISLTLSSISPDGKYLLFSDILTDDNTSDIWLLDLETEKVVPFIKTRYTELNAMFSPSGNWVLYSSQESGQNEVYAQEFKERGERWQISSGGGIEARWSNDESTIYYRKNNNLYAVPFDPLTGPDRSQEKIIFDNSSYVSLFGGLLLTHYDINPKDGKFLMVKSRTGKEPSINVIFNWFHEIDALFEASK